MIGVKPSIRRQINKQTQKQRDEKKKQKKSQAKRREAKKTTTTRTPLDWLMIFYAYRDAIEPIILQMILSSLQI